MLSEIRFTNEARNDLKDLLLASANKDKLVAKQLFNTIESAISFLKISPFSSKRSQSNNPFLREFLITFDGYGYTALIELEESKMITVLAVRDHCDYDYY